MGADSWNNMTKQVNIFTHGIDMDAKTTKN